MKEVDFTPQADVFPSPRDWRDVFLYQLLIDRFDDGRDRPAASDSQPGEPRDDSAAGQFNGGTLKGVTRRLDYIKNLGCDAVWISPPFKQRKDDEGSYHGYAIQDFLAVDPRFGTIEDLKGLVREAHARGMYVILDIVINHAGDVFRYEEDQTPYDPDGRVYAFKEWHRVKPGVGPLTPDDAVWPVELQTPEAFKRRGGIRDLANAPPDEVVNADFFSLKDLDTENPAVVDALIGAFKYWIAVADVDGYRIDTVKHVEPAFCAKFCNAIHEYCKLIGKDNFLLFGEIVGDDDLLAKYVGNNGPAAGTDEWYPRLDAALDFPLYGSLDDVIRGDKSCGELRARYDHFRSYWRDQGEAAKYYVTFLDNHDQGHRPFRRFLGGIGDAGVRNKLGVQGVAYLLTNLGIPCIYYGTEQGFDGHGQSDQYVREAMFGGDFGAFGKKGVHHFDPEHPIYRGIAAVAKVRRDEPALRYGRQYFRDTSDDGQKFTSCEGTGGVLAFGRILDSREVTVVVNLDDHERTTWVQVGGQVHPPGTKVRDLLGDETTYEVADTPAGPAVRLPLDGRAVRVLRRD